MISTFDEILGRLLDRLDEHGIAGETLVILTSDNGPTWAGGVDANFFRSAGDLRGLEGTLFEGGIRVPLVVRWPGRVPAGTGTDAVAAAWDLLPTILEAAGLPPGGSVAGPPIDGRSLLPVLTGRTADLPPRFLYWEHPEGPQQQAVMLGRWKGIRERLRGGDRTIRLYDVTVDETTDRAAEHPDLVERVERIMAEARMLNPLFPIAALDQPTGPDE